MKSRVLIAAALLASLAVGCKSRPDSVLKSNPSDSQEAYTVLTCMQKSSTTGANLAAHVISFVNQDKFSAIVSDFSSGHRIDIVELPCTGSLVGRLSCSNLGTIGIPGDKMSFDKDGNGLTKFSSQSIENPGMNIEATFQCFSVRM